MIGTRDQNIIHIEHNNGTGARVREHVVVSIDRAQPYLLHEVSDGVVPHARGLLQTIESLLQLTDPVERPFQLEASGLHHVDHFLHGSMQEGCQGDCREKSRNPGTNMGVMYFILRQKESRFGPEDETVL